eukprot:221289-Chlamydomonas_euryale.AAC.7
MILQACKRCHLPCGRSIVLARAEHLPPRQWACINNCHALFAEGQHICNQGTGRSLNKKFVCQVTQSAMRCSIAAAAASY